MVTPLPTPGPITRAQLWDSDAELKYDGVHPLPVDGRFDLAPGTEFVGKVGAQPKVVRVRQVIPAAGDYGIADVVSNSVTAAGARAWKFEGLARTKFNGQDRTSGNGFWVVRASLGCSSTTITAMIPRLHCFTSDPTASELRDNVALNIALADAPSYKDVIDGFTAFASRGGFSSTGNNDVRKHIVAAPGDDSLYIILETTAAEANETASMVMWMELEVIQD